MIGNIRAHSRFNFLEPQIWLSFMLQFSSRVDKDRLKGTIYSSALLHKSWPGWMLEAF